MKIHRYALMHVLLAAAIATAVVLLLVIASGLGVSAGRQHAMAGAWVGFAVYASRELAQWELRVSLKAPRDFRPDGTPVYWDGPGFWYPTIAMAVFAVLV